MARVPRSALERLNAESQALVERGAQIIADAIMQGATKEQIESLMSLICKGVADVSAVRAAVFYKANRLLQTGETWEAEPYSGYDDGESSAIVDAIIAKFAESPTEVLAIELGKHIDYTSRNALNETILENAFYDPDNPKVARVPTGAETCPFCLILASRGFEYVTHGTIDTLKHAHANCDCLIVPQYGENSIEGYDPGVYEKVYEDNVVYDKYGHVDEQATRAKIYRDNYDSMKDHRNELRRKRYAETHPKESSA